MAFQVDTSVVVLFVLCLGILFVLCLGVQNIFVLLAPYVCLHILVKLK